MKFAGTTALRHNANCIKLRTVRRARYPRKRRIRIARVHAQGAPRSIMRDIAGLGSETPRINLVIAAPKKSAGEAKERSERERERKRSVRGNQDPRETSRGKNFPASSLRFPVTRRAASINKEAGRASVASRRGGPRTRAGAARQVAALIIPALGSPPPPLLLPRPAR